MHVKRTLYDVSRRTGLARRVRESGIDERIEDLVFPIRRPARICGNDVTFTFNSLYWYMVSDISSDANWWLENIVAMFFAKVVRPGDVVYDVGANHGYYSLLGAFRSGASGRVVSFEPTRQFRFALTRNVRENALPATVTVESATVDANDTIDEYVDDHPPPDVVKVDIGGGEWRVLQTMSGTLHDYEPTVLVEVDARDAPDIYGCLSDCGYHIDRIREFSELEIDVDPERPHPDDRHHLLAYQGEPLVPR